MNHVSLCIRFLNEYLLYQPSCRKTLLPSFEGEIATLGDADTKLLVVDFSVEAVVPVVLKGSFGYTI